MNRAYTPESVAVARAAVRGHEPPTNITSPEFGHSGLHLSELRRDVAEERCWEIVSFGHCHSPHQDHMEQLLQDGNPELRLRAIDHALREALLLFYGTRTAPPRSILDFRYQNLHRGVLKAIHGELAALLSEWDRLTGGVA